MKRPSLARANAKLRQLVGDLHARVDAHHERMDQNPHAPAISCREGCASAPRGCCSLLTLVELSEADYIVARNEAAVRAAMPRLIAAYRRHVAAGITPESLAGMLRTQYENGGKRAVDEERELTALYHSLYQACPLLGDDRKCTVYEDRPIACRTHFVMSPPETCEPCGENDNHWILDKGSRAGPQAQLLRAVMAERRGELMIGTLPQSVLAAWRARHPHECRCECGRELLEADDARCAVCAHEMP